MRFAHEILAEILYELRSIIQLYAVKCETYRKDPLRSYSLHSPIHSGSCANSPYRAQAPAFVARVQLATEPR